MELLKALERVSIPIEGELVKLIEEDQVLTQQLYGGGLVVVVGTDEKYSLAVGLREIFPQSDIKIIDHNPDRVKQAAKFGFDCIEAEVGGDESYPVIGASLVVAKHLLHFVPNKTKALTQMKEMSASDGVLMVSVPAILKGMVSGAVEEFGQQYEEEVVGQWLNKSVVWKIQTGVTESTGGQE